MQAKRRNPLNGKTAQKGGVQAKECRSASVPDAVYNALSGVPDRTGTVLA